MIKHWLWPLALWLVQNIGLSAQDYGSWSHPTHRGDLRLFWYNVENLFYPVDDSLGGDDDFTPEGVRRWTYTRYRNKVTALARVIVAAGEWEPPDVVGLCEVEDSLVLEDLVSHPVLESYHYRYLHKKSQDHRGMDVACLYRDKRVEVVNWNVYTPWSSREKEGTRDVLHLFVKWGRRDSMDLFLVHLISKYGGAGATAALRRTQAHLLLQWMDSVNILRGGSLKILAGDFNDSFQGYSLEPLRKGRIGGDSLLSLPLSGGQGSYKYRGKWNQIDQFLVLGSGKGYQLKGFYLNLWPLLKEDETYGGQKPFRTYEGYSYAGGVSDHLPIVLDIYRPSRFSPKH